MKQRHAGRERWNYLTFFREAAAGAAARSHASRRNSAPLLAKEYALISRKGCLSPPTKTKAVV